MAVELTTVVRVDGDAHVDFDEMVGRLDDAVRAAITELGMVAVTAYFVAPDAGAKNIHVGLRFERMQTQYIEDTADEVLERAFELLADADDVERRDVRSLRSQLVSA